MKNDVTEYVKTCVNCQQIKSPSHMPYGLLQPLPPPTAVWEAISLDFIIGLPSFQNNTVILVVVDRFLRRLTFVCFPPPSLQLKLLICLLSWCVNFMACLRA